MPPGYRALCRQLIQEVVDALRYQFKVTHRDVTVNRPEMRLFQAVLDRVRCPLDIDEPIGGIGRRYRLVAPQPKPVQSDNRGDMLIVQSLRPCR